MTARAWLELSRCSNLPTVWTNVLHGLAAGVFVRLERGGPDMLAVMPTSPGWFFNHGFLMFVAGSLIYVAGMILNDAFDTAEDRKTRPGRPIPRGDVSRRSAFVVGFVLLGAGAALGFVFVSPLVPALLLALAACVTAYDALHRVKALAFVLMPSCRALLFLAAAAATGTRASDTWDQWLAWATHPHVLAGAVVLAGYTMAVSFAAWAEDRGDTKRKQITAGLMIAMMCFVDAAGLLALGQNTLAMLCVGGVLLTVLLQRGVPGT